MNVAERLMVEEFDNLYPNRASLAIALKSSPTPAFRETRRVTEFTDSEKVEYIKELRTREYLMEGRRHVSDDDITEWLKDTEDYYSLAILDCLATV